MSLNLSTAFVAAYTERAKAAYQKGARLGGTVREVTGVVGSTHRFDVYGKITAPLHIPNSPVTFTNPTVSVATATLADYSPAILTDKFDQQKIRWDEVMMSADAIGKALGRRKDQIVIDAMTNATPSNTIAYNDSSMANNAFNVGRLRYAKSLLDDDGVDEGDRHIAVRADALRQLLGSTAATSHDYAAVKSLVNGEVNTFLGFKFHTIETRTEGGLPLNTGTRYYAYAWHKEAVGYAEGIGPQIEIARETQYRSRAVYGDLSAGAVVIEADGWVEIEYDSAVAVNLNEA